MTGLPHCSRCGSARLHRSRRRSPIEFGIALTGWSLKRCHDCKARYLQFGRVLVPAYRLQTLARGLLFATLSLAAVGVVIAAILFFGHSQSPSSPTDGVLFAPSTAAAMSVVA